MPLRASIPRLGIQGRATILLLVGLLLGATLAFSFAAELRSLGAARSVEQNAYQARLLSADLRLAMNASESAIQGYALTGNSDFRTDFDAAHRQVATTLAGLSGVHGDAQERAQLLQVNSAVSNWNGWAQTTLAMGPAQIPPPPSTTMEGEHLFEAYLTEIGTLSALLKVDVADAQGSATLNSQRALIYVLLASATGVIILGLLAMYLFRSMLRPVNRLAEIARQMAGGSQVRVPSLDREDEIGELARALSSAQDGAAERVRLLEAMATETGRNLRRMAALNEISLAIVRGGGESAALTVLVEHAADVALADYVQLLIPTGGDEFEIEFAAGPAGDEIAGLEVSMSRSLAGNAYRSGETVTSPNASHDRRASRATAQRLKAGPVVACPIGGPDNVRGVLVAIRQTGRPEFQAGDIQLLDTLAAQASLAMEYGLLQRASRTLARIEERERIANDLRDGVIQSLFGIGIGLQAAASMEPSPAVGQRLAAAVKELDQTITRMRDLVFGLHPDQPADTSWHSTEASAVTADKLGG